MQVVTSYGIHIRDHYDALKRTAEIFSDAVTYLTGVAFRNWENLSLTDSSYTRLRMMECLIHSGNGNVSSDSFDKKFHKFPSYYRRSAIMQAIGIVSAYQAALKTWEESGRKGAEPKMDSGVHHMPALYRGNTYKPVTDPDTGEDLPYVAKIKVFRNSDWVWETVRLSKTDADYLEKRGRNGEISAPVLEKKHGCWKLRFAVTETVKLSDKPVREQKICAVDLGVNTDAVCSVMNSMGTVLARRFITCGRENSLRVVNSKCTNEKNAHYENPFCTGRVFFRAGCHDYESASVSFHGPCVVDSEELIHCRNDSLLVFLAF